MTNKDLIKLHKMYRKMKAQDMLAHKYYYGYDANVIFLRMLEFRQKSHGYKKQNYCDNFYYITTSGELGCIKSKGRNSGRSLGELLVRRKVIDKKTFEANKEINGGPDTFGIKGVIIKHNRVLEDFKHKFAPKVIDYISKFFDQTHPCDMIIDHDFNKAYAPRYHESNVYAGDLCTSGSCMSGRGEGAQSFYGKIPCCSVVRFEQNGEQVGRCIMYEYEGKRHFIRVYGKPEYLSKMYRLIRKEMKPNDLFGRDFCINDLRCDTTIDGESQNMYLDGRHYGLVAYKDEDDNDKYIMCTESNSYKIEKETKGRYNSMKSTSDEKMKHVFTFGDSEDYYTCEHCGERVHAYDAYWAGDCVYCCSDCAHEEGWRCCDECGEDFNIEEEGILTGDDEHYFCCGRCANRHGYYKCEVCGRYEPDTVAVDGLCESICDDCLEKKERDGEVVMCDYCQEYCDADYARKVYRKDDHREVWVCDDCWNNSEWCRGQYDEIKEDEDVKEE